MGQEYYAGANESRSNSIWMLVGAGGSRWKSKSVKVDMEALWEDPDDQAQLEASIAVPPDRVGRLPSPTQIKETV